MNEIETYIQQFITKICIIFNAVQLGWLVDIVDGQIVLSKESNKLTKLDKDTKELISALICNDNDINMIQCI